MTIRAELVEQARAQDIGRAAAAAGLKLRRIGRELIGPCPSCGGTDRFAVSLTKQVFRCRQCGGKGDVIEFVKFITGKPFAESVAILTGTWSRPQQRPARGATMAPRIARPD